MPLRCFHFQGRAYILYCRVLGLHDASKVRCDEMRMPCMKKPWLGLAFRRFYMAEMPPNESTSMQNCMRVHWQVIDSRPMIKGSQYEAILLMGLRDNAIISLLYIYNRAEFHMPHIS